MASRGGRFVRRHADLEVYKRAFEAAMRLFGMTRDFPPEERCSLTDQIRRASRSVCSNLAEAWRKRRYPAAFVSKLGDAEGEAAETQVWIQFSVACNYVQRGSAADLYEEYNAILGMIVDMIVHAGDWTMRTRKGPG